MGIVRSFFGRASRSEVFENLKKANFSHAK
jgi:hypothetical protein